MIAKMTADGSRCTGYHLMKSSLTFVSLWAAIAVAATVSFAQPNPETLWTRTYGGSTDDYAFSVQQTADGGYIVAGWTSSFAAGGYKDFYLVKTGPELSADEPFILQPMSLALSAFPNPFNPSTTIAYDLPKASRVSLRVFDLLGREVAVLKNGFVEAGNHQLTFEGSDLVSGVYFARIEAGQFSETKKLMLLK